MLLNTLLKSYYSYQKRRLSVWKAFFFENILKSDD